MIRILRQIHALFATMLHASTASILRAVSLIAALLMAPVGVGALYVAIVAFTNDRPRVEETMPTPLALTDFEKDGVVPGDKRWLELSDGVLLWNECSTEIEVWKFKNKKKELVVDRAIFVPLVSKKAYDIGQKSNDDLKQPIQVARVYVRFKPGVVGAELPLQQTNVDHRPRLRGIAATLKKEPDFLREGLAPKGSLKDPAKLLVVRYNESPPSSDNPLVASICLGITGVILFLPLVGWLVWMLFFRKRAKSA